MSLTELAEWRKANPDAPLYQCANIQGIVHLVTHCGLRKFSTRCGISGDPGHHVLAFLLPAHLVTCVPCQAKL
jgi:hypothetical protein